MLKVLVLPAAAGPIANSRLRRHVHGGTVMPVRTPESIVAEAQSLLRLITVMEAHDRSRPGSPLRRYRAETRQWVQDIIARNRPIVEAR